MVCRLKRRPQADHFIEDAAKRPNIRLRVVVRLFDLLRRHVVRCSDIGVRVLRLGGQNPAKPEISELHIVVLVEEKVARLQVSVQNDMLSIFFRRVALVERQQDLHEDLPDNVFSDEVFLRAAFLDKLRHVAIFAVLHHDQKFVLLLEYDLVIVLHNV